MNTTLFVVNQLNFVEEINLNTSKYLIDNCDILVFLVALGI